jgi:putative nucleotidyltransferase with HDIG domain
MPKAKMSRKQIKEIEETVHKAFRSPKNHAGYSAWTHHVVPATKFAKKLAKELGADAEIVELSVILHDLGSVTFGAERQDEHHITGAKLAEKILREYDYPKDRMEKVKHCIVSHRATKNIPRKTLEAKIVASADAMSHFAYVNDLFWLVYVPKSMETDEGTKFVLKKLENSYRKLMPEAKKMVDGKYKAIKKALSNDIIKP